MAIKNMSPILTWVNDLIQLFSQDVITTPSTYKEQVNAVKGVLSEDISGFVSTILDFSVNCSNVNYKLETNDDKKTEYFNKFLKDINSDLRGIIPTGINALAKEYFRERWKSSSFLILRVLWGKKDGVNIPKKLWFVDGKDIEISENKNTKVIGNKKYYLRINQGEDDKGRKLLPRYGNESIYIQKPYSTWSEDYTVPYVIQKGIYKNLKFLELLETKGEYVVAKALEYLGLLKKGTEGMATTQNPDCIYSEDDLKKIKDDFTRFASDRKLGQGLSTYTTNFDTSYEHIIPDYKKAISHELFIAVEKRLLSGLGLVDVLQGVSSTRKESVLSPRPFISEVESGISDFKELMLEVVREMIDKNKELSVSTVSFSNSPIKAFLSDDMKSLLRSVYDRGNLSRKSFIEDVAGFDYDVELNRIKHEKESGEAEALFPPVITNIEKDIEPSEPNDNVPDDKKSVEKKNYTVSLATLPDKVKKSMTKELQQIWIQSFNGSLESYTKEQANKIAWATIKKISKKDKNGKLKKI